MKLSIEVTINAVIDPDSGESNVLDWQFDVNPPGDFHALPPALRAAFWSRSRDEIEETWFSAALGSDPNAIWNWRLEELDLE
jgi:hypothetical protein